MRTWMRRNPVLAFYLVTFAVSWLIWIPATPFLQDPAHISTGLVLLAYASIYTPTLAAIFLTGLESGTAGIRTLFRRFLIWRVGLQWYLFALFGSTAIGLGAMALYDAGGGVLPPFSPNFLAVVFLLVAGPLSEEMGWRGYAFPRLQARYGAMPASILVGTLWAVWHLPGFIWPSVLYNVPIPFTWFLLLVIAWSILFTWLYNNTNGSLLLAFLFHLGIDATMAILPLSGRDLALLYLVVTWGVVLVVVMWGRRSFPSRHQFPFSQARQRRIRLPE